MTLKEIHRVEREKWDSLAYQTLPTVTSAPDASDFLEFARNSRMLREAVGFLGDLDGKRVLEYGCGFGKMAVLLAKSNARVTAFDLSPASVAVGRKRASLAEVENRIDFCVSAGERLPYADESFDVIIGKAILHHVDVDHGRHDLYRVLAPGGKAVFTEPLGMNPVLNFVRDYVPYPNKTPRGSDRPLEYTTIRAWGEPFNRFRYQEIYLLTMLERGFGFRQRFPTLRQLDDFLLRHVQLLRRYCWYVVLFMEK